MAFSYVLECVRFFEVHAVSVHCAARFLLALSQVGQFRHAFRLGFWLADQILELLQAWEPTQSVHFRHVLLLLLLLKRLVLWLTIGLLAFDIIEGWSAWSSHNCCRLCLSLFQFFQLLFESCNICLTFLLNVFER